MAASDRRRSPRIWPAQPLEIRVDDVDADLSVLDVSFGGLRIEGPVTFDREGTHRVRIAGIAGSAALELQAKAVYSSQRPGTSPRYETGFAFLGLGDPSTEARVQALIEAVTSVLVVE